MFSRWCIDWVGSPYANQIFMHFCIKSSIGTQGEVAGFNALPPPPNPGGLFYWPFLAVVP